MNSAIEWMARHGVAPNLLMGFMFLTGILSFYSIPVEVFPEITLETLTVRIEYLGASPNEIEESILLRIEEQIEGIDGISSIKSTAIENLGIVTIELTLGQNVSAKLDEIKAEIDRITTFPEGSEKPEVKILSNRKRVIEIAIAGNISERDLKELAYKIKEDLASKNNISLVEVGSVRDYEISIEIDNNSLKENNITLTKLADIVKKESLDLPAGEIGSKNEDIVLRTLGRNYNKTDFDEIVILTGKNAAQVKLKDIANVDDGFRDEDLISLFNGKPAAFVKVYRIGNEQVLSIVDTVQSYLENELRPNLPEGTEAIVWRDDAEELESRLSLLITNGSIGLILVIITLTLFLDIRLAFWTSLGILVAFIAAVTVMNVTGYTINQISLFGFILAIGIVVDDAIVIGENIYSSNMKGLSPIEASIQGAQRVAVPVFFAVSTTIVAFSPLIFVPGESGKFLGQMPIVVIILLLLSILEATLILPYHLSQHNFNLKSKKNFIIIFIENKQRWVSNQLDEFINGKLNKALIYVTQKPWTIVSSAFSIIIVAYSIVAFGYLKIQFFPVVEGKYITATLEMKTGTPLEQTALVANKMLNYGLKVDEELKKQLKSDRNFIKASYVIVGSQDFASPPFGGLTILPDGNKASVVLELVKPQDRSFSATDFQNKWRNIAEIPQGISRLYFSSQLFNLGEPIQLELSANSDEELIKAITFVEDKLEEIVGVFDVRNDLDEGKREIQLSLKPQARVYGITLENLALQLRAAFFGSEAMRVQRGREEIRVYTRLPEGERDSIYDLLNYRIRIPNKGFVPLGAVAELNEGISPSTINRKNNRRIVSITADVDSINVTGDEISILLDNDIMPRLLKEVPTAKYEFGGEQGEQNKALPALGRNFIASLFVIYALLAIAFRSYMQPLIIMAAIPFATIGAIIGHLIIGINLTLPGIFGIVGLSGVIVNGSLVMIDFINEEIKNGKNHIQSIIDGAKSRFRPIFLTAITTFLGVFPLIIEKSIQGQFLVPVACSIGFGVLFGTALQVLLVPALMTIQSKTVKN
jgi:multidrug efflux pump subunit AcrB